MRRWLPRLGLVALGLALGVLIAEGAARVLAPAGGADLLFDAPGAVPAGTYTHDPVLGMVPTPGFRGEVRSLGYRVEVRFDELGLRGAGLAPRSEAARWLVVGDSFALSLQVPEEASFPARLADATGVEVYNGGVDGYSTWAATERYRRLEPAVEPDAVLLVFFLGNDLRDNQRRPGEGPPTIGPPPPQGSRRPEAPSLLDRHSHLYARLRVGARARALRRGDDPDRDRWRGELALFTAEGRADLEAASGDTRQALEALRGATRARGDQLLVAVAPPALSVDRERAGPTLAMVGLDPAGADLDAPARAVLDLLDTLGVQACDLGPALREAEGGGPTYFRYDGHWTPRGHRAVGEALAACLAR